MSTNFTKFQYTPRRPPPPPPRRHAHGSTGSGTAGRDTSETAERRRLRVNYVQLRRRRRLTILKKADEYHKLLGGHISVVMYEDGKFLGYTSKPGNPKWPPSFRQIDMTFPVPEIYSPESDKPWRDLVAHPERNSADRDDNTSGELGEERRATGAVGDGNTNRPAHTTAPLPTSAALQEALLGFQLQSLGAPTPYRPILPVPREPSALPCSITDVTRGGHHDEDSPLSTTDDLQSIDDGIDDYRHGEKRSGRDGSTDDCTHTSGSGEDGDDETSGDDYIHGTWRMAKGGDGDEDSARQLPHARPIARATALSRASAVTPRSLQSVPLNADPGRLESPISRRIYDERRFALPTGPHLAPAHTSEYRQAAHRIVKRHIQRRSK